MQWTWAGASSKMWRWSSWTSGHRARPSRSSSSPRPLTECQSSTPPCHSAATHLWRRSRRSWRLQKSDGRWGLHFEVHHSVSPSLKLLKLISADTILLRHNSPSPLHIKGVPLLQHCLNHKHPDVQAFSLSPLPSSARRPNCWSTWQRRGSTSVRWSRRPLRRTTTSSRTPRKNWSRRWRPSRRTGRLCWLPCWRGCRKRWERPEQRLK